MQRGGLTGTVGAVAVDGAGRLAAATSTGGRGHERPGRVSDSCTIAGTWAGPRVAVSCTGVGEEIVEAGLAVRIGALCEHGLSTERAVDEAVRRLVAAGGRAGAIVCDADGRVAVFTTTESIVWAASGPEPDVRTWCGTAGWWSDAAARRG